MCMVQFASVSCRAGYRNLGLPEKTVEEIQEEKMIFDVFAEAAALFRKAGRKEYGS